MSSELGYQRDSGRDFALAEAAGLDIIFAPAADELFPREPMTTVSLPAMSSDVPHLEDPAHLDLVAMVMCKLWNIFGPCRSYFGEKDWQQLVMYQRLADDLGWPVTVIGCPTVREPDGLAVSSRNAQLAPGSRDRPAALPALLPRTGRSQEARGPAPSSLASSASATSGRRVRRCRRRVARPDRLLHTRRGGVHVAGGSAARAGCALLASRSHPGAPGGVA